MKNKTAVFVFMLLIGSVVPEAVTAMKPKESFVGKVIKLTGPEGGLVV